MIDLLLCLFMLVGAVVEGLAHDEAVLVVRWFMLTVRRARLLEGAASVRLDCRSLVGNFLVRVRPFTAAAIASILVINILHCVLLMRALFCLIVLFLLGATYLSREIFALADRAKIFNLFCLIAIAANRALLVFKLFSSP